MTALTLGQSVSRVSGADDASTSSEADINRVSRSRGGCSSRGEEGKCGTQYNNTTAHSDADCRARSTNNLIGDAHFAQVRPSSVPRICSSWDLPARDDSNEKPCISFLAREAQPATKPAKARVEENGTRPFGPVPTAATEGWRTRPWPFTSRAEPAISFGGPVAEEKFKMANGVEPVEKALIASLSAAVIFEDSVNSNLATLMVDSGVPGHYFDDVIIRDLKHRLQDYMHLATSRTIFTAGGAMLDGTAEGVLQGLVTDDYGNLFGSISWGCPGLGATWSRL